MLDLLLLFRASVCAFTVKVRHTPISGRFLVINDPPLRWHLCGWSAGGSSEA
jgi:hypothetical protein